ncbi:MAG: hypothetical protein A2498_11510 [Lentisphaerae bacterium RIFOXYC12_FULL_60_16]|nr:MAG: hypothetical protein A2498_11510 [Lentisphaerae bacterium RIFOXYC12_FULL_60_16]
MTSTPYHAVIFDMDGTLTVPVLDFNAIRAEIGLDTRGDLSDDILRLAPVAQARAWAVVERHEQRAREQQTLQTGALELLTRCRSTGMRVGLATRNTRASVDHFMQRFNFRFDGITTREEPPLKPHPQAILRLIDPWGIPPESTLVVGDFRHDIESGYAAGTRTCFFQNPGVPFTGERADFVVDSMQALAELIF